MPLQRTTERFQPSCRARHNTQGNIEIEGELLLKKLQDDMIAFADHRIEPISVNLSKNSDHQATEQLLDRLGALMQEHGMLKEYNDLCSVSA